jgi:hypothetical protein
VLGVAWPFLVGLAAGWAIGLGRRLPPAGIPFGVAAWAGTLLVGMVIRQATGAGVALSFVVVAGAVTAALLIGWRAAAGLALARREKAPTSTPTR